MNIKAAIIGSPPQMPPTDCESAWVNAWLIPAPELAASKARPPSALCRKRRSSSIRASISPPRKERQGPSERDTTPSAAVGAPSSAPIAVARAPTAASSGTGPQVGTVNPQQSDVGGGIASDEFAAAGGLISYGTKGASSILAEFVQIKVDVIVTVATPPTLAAKQATAVIPIVFGVVSDPVGTGLVASLARPGGNAMSPATSRNVPGGVYEVIKRLPDNGSEPEYRIKSANEPHERVARESELTRLGGLLSYGVDLTDNFRRAAAYVDRILKGAKPSELPVQAPVKFELVVNLKTAKTLGLDVPLHLQQRADEVIE
jgi:ABC transporter substrate binding protein